SLHFDFSITARDFTPVWKLPQQLDARLDSPTSWDLEQQRWVLDPDGDSLRFSLATPLPDGVSFSDGVLSVDPEHAAPGRYTLDFNVSDGADRPLVAASTVLQLSGVASPEPARLLPVEVADRLAFEGTVMALPLQLDRPLAAAASLDWLLHGGFDQAEAFTPLRGTLALEPGSTQVVLELQLPDDRRIQPAQQFFLQLQSDSPDLLLPTSPLALRQLDNDGIPAQLETRWLSATEVELVYSPAAQAMATTGLRIELRDPSGSGLLQQAQLHDLFAMGWQSPVRDATSLVLEWRDPLAATWPSLAEVSLVRLQLPQPLPADVELMVAASSGRSDVAVHWLDQPWLDTDADAALDPAREAITAARLAGAPVLIEQELAGALRFSDQAELEVVDVAALLERRFSGNPSISVSTGGHSFSVDLTPELQESGSSVRLSDTQWGLLPPLAQGASRLGLQAEQVMVLSSDGGRLVDVSLQPLSDVGVEELLQGLTVAGVAAGSQPLQPVYGVMNFSFTDIELGSLQTVWIDLPYRSVVDGVLSKPDADGVWSPFSFDAVDGTGAIFHDDDGDGFDDRVELRLRDGGRGDADGLINGVIVDPAIASSSDASNDPLAPTDLQILLGAFESVGSLGGSGDSIDAVRFEVAAGQQLATLRLDEFSSSGGAVEAWIFASDEPIDLASRQPLLVSGSGLELMQGDPLPAGSYTLVLRQLSGRSSYVLRGGSVPVPSTDPVYDVVTSFDGVDEGGLLSFTITTEHVPQGEVLHWSLLPAGGSALNPADFVPAQLNGTVQIGADGTAQISRQVAADLLTEGDERFQLQLFADAARTQSLAQSAELVIHDLSITPLPSFALATPRRMIDEGDVLVASLTTTAVDPGTEVFWRLEGLDDSSVSATDLRGGQLSGQLTTQFDGTALIRQQISLDLLDEASESMRLAIYADAQYSDLLASSEELLIRDTAHPLMVAGELNALSLVYAPDQMDLNQQNLVVDVFYDSDWFIPSGLESLAPVFSQINLLDDVDDLDGDSRTDGLLRLTLDDLAAVLPSLDSPSQLAELQFQAANDRFDPLTGEPVVAQLSIQASSDSGPIDWLTGSLEWKAALTTPSGFTLDFDGDGQVSLYTDGIWAIRRFIGLESCTTGFSDDYFAQNGRRSAEQVDALLDQAFDAGFFDFDQNGKTSLYTDGILLIRHLISPGLIDASAEVISADSPFKTTPSLLNEVFDQLKPTAFEPPIN
ncbi:MAG: choice-of-anchor U domain-containing protein, partial [Synechococcus sp.]|nr:choice-of-anchor U domain-containing protein [Synechococcus sp.]